MIRRIVVGAIAAALIAWPAAASAHEEISPSSIVTGKPVFFVLSAANEAKADLTKVTLKAASGVAFGSTTHQPNGWSVEHSEDTISWAASAAAVKPDTFEQWGFEIEGADQPGTLTYTVVLGFADGTSDNVKVPVIATAPGTADTAGAPATLVRSARDRANTAMVLAVAALVIAAIALMASLIRRGSGNSAAGDW